MSVESIYGFFSSQVDDRYRKNNQSSPEAQSKQGSKVLDPPVPSRSESFSNGNSEPVQPSLQKPMESQVKSLWNVCWWDGKIKEELGSNIYGNQQITFHRYMYDTLIENTFPYFYVRESLILLPDRLTNTLLTYVLSVKSIFFHIFPWHFLKIYFIPSEFDILKEKFYLLFYLIKLIFHGMDKQWLK